MTTPTTTEAFRTTMLSDARDWMSDLEDCYVIAHDCDDEYVIMYVARCYDGGWSSFAIESCRDFPAGYDATDVVWLMEMG